MIDRRNLGSIGLGVVGPKPPQVPTGAWVSVSIGRRPRPVHEDAAGGRAGSETGLALGGTEALIAAQDLRSPPGRLRQLPGLRVVALAGRGRIEYLWESQQRCRAVRGQVLHVEEQPWR